MTSISPDRGQAPDRPSPGASVGSSFGGNSHAAPHSPNPGSGILTRISTRIAGYSLLGGGTTPFFV